MSAGRVQFASAGKKLFRVRIEVSFDMVVLATEEEEASAAAKEHWLTEVEECAIEPSTTLCHEVDDAAQLSFYDDLESAYPFALGDDLPGESVAFYLREMGIAVPEPKEEA
jgi:hypothetical protein